MKHLVFIFVFATLTGNVLATDSTRYVIKPVSISFFDNQTSLPVGAKPGMFQSPLHPGIALHYSLCLKENIKHERGWNAHLGYYYHQYSQHGIQLYGTYRYTLFPLSRRSLFLSGEGGAGYLHAIPALEQFKLNSNGTYERKFRWGRPQAMLSLQASVGWRFKSDSRVYLGYQFWMQTPFVKTYVPLLPNSALHVGYSFHIKHRRCCHAK